LLLHVVVDFRDTPLIRRRLEQGHHKDAHGPFGTEEIVGALSDVGFVETRAEAVRAFVLAQGLKS
jgi:hypothetical protein